MTNNPIEENSEESILSLTNRTMDNTKMEVNKDDQAHKVIFSSVVTNGMTTLKGPTKMTTATITKRNISPRDSTINISF